MKKQWIVLALLLGGCATGFEEINTNPNAPIQVQPELLLRQVIYNYGDEMAYEGFVAGNLLGQQFTMVDFNLFDRHDLSSPQLGGNPWPTVYTNLRDNEQLLALARENEVYAVYEGPALILKAYMAATVTDLYGDVPYFEALQGLAGNTTPAYDGQEEIYTAPGGILDNLRQGVAALEGYAAAQTLGGDILFEGDLDAWVAFGNSLLIKYLVRIADRVAVGPELQALADGGNYIADNAANATFDFTNTQPNTFRMAVLRSGDFNLFVMSETMQEITADLGDPRVAVWFRPSEADGTFAGLLNGVDASNTSISVADYSLAGTIFRENTALLDANYMTAWETYFLLAEAAQRGVITGDAQAWYELGMAQAFAYWHTDLPDDYLTTGNAAYGANGADPIEQIITQKWLASLTHGYEGWMEYRRTGFPQLKTVAASLNNDLIPVRMPYPAEEAALNAEAYQNATATNQNSVNARVWWDMN